jgi:hypothetical protein
MRNNTSFFLDLSLLFSLIPLTDWVFSTLSASRFNRVLAAALPLPYFDEVITKDKIQLAG